MRVDAVRSISITRQGCVTSLHCNKRRKEGCPNKITPILNRKCVTRSQIRQTTNTAGRVHSEGALAGEEKERSNLPEDSSWTQGVRATSSAHFLFIPFPLFECVSFFLPCLTCATV
ncbi:hypothetical protein CDAR_117941 [Caerostris darwini]|uniref:Uncharacterized protein n=1 Tax=Caerostris darwini TaxID=1538125 RepID=A0AAV4PZP1_9ARAC|nr:hypothetical protein CDAR_117941 [Caerostris darwini]